ncbi:PIN domain-containing protein [Cellvibrio sp. OA-2007]|uniref:PIN domain-containing protein n=1 Tax=Cellvibrio sp. OA-2007 TaxID=529823 RepID=UPI0007861CBA|nr:PIN domain-containing protein [Cellvibrio sp. OA-2007]
MRKNYIFIDYENVQPESIAGLEKGNFYILLFLGANQSKINTQLARSLQPLGSRVEYISLSGSGKNALDFHIAYYIGERAAIEPEAYFHIVSKDAGFDPLIEHLNERNILASRSGSIGEISILQKSSLKTLPERTSVVKARLAQMEGKPNTVKTLSSTINALFQKTLSDDEVDMVVKDLCSKGLIAIINKTRVAYLMK